MLVLRYGVVVADAKMEKELPRYWAILFALDYLGEIYNNFNLQKYLFLAQREAHVPMEYVFSKNDYGPYCSNIKQDAMLLDTKGFIKMSFGLGWEFRLTDRGREMYKKIIKLIPPDVHNSFIRVLHKYGSYSRVALGEYVYKNYMKSLEEIEELKRQLIVEGDFLITNFQNLEASSNTFFLLGTVDYCKIALKKEQLRDEVQKGHLVSVIERYIEKINDFQECLDEKLNILSDISLNCLTEDFGYLQDICKGYAVLPALDDENLDLADLILEE